MVSCTMHNICYSLFPGRPALVCKISYCIRHGFYIILYLQAGQSDDERVERLLGVLEQRDATLLAKFYAALRAAGQEEIVNLLREG